MADQKITQLTETTSPSLNDVLPIVTNTDTTPVTKRVKFSNLVNQVHQKQIDPLLDTIIATVPLATLDAFECILEGTYIVTNGTNIFINSFGIAIVATIKGGLLSGDFGGTIYAQKISASGAGSDTIAVFGSFSSGILSIAFNPGFAGLTPSVGYPKMFFTIRSKTGQAITYV